MKKGEVWYVKLPSTDGREQAGERPVIIFSRTNVNTNMVIPFTTNLQALRFPYTIEVKPSKKNGLNDISVALIFQLRAIDKKRFSNKTGEISASVLRDIESQVKKLLEL